MMVLCFSFFLILYHHHHHVDQSRARKRWCSARATLDRIRTAIFDKLGALHPTGCGDLSGAYKSSLCKTQSTNSRLSAEKAIRDWLQSISQKKAGKQRQPELVQDLTGLTYFISMGHRQMARMSTSKRGCAQALVPTATSDPRGLALQRTQRLLSTAMS